MIKDRVISLYVSSIDEEMVRIKDGLLSATSWEEVLRLQGAATGLITAKNALDNVLEDEDQ